MRKVIKKDKDKKTKWGRNCFSCKYRQECKEKFRVEVCDKFKFAATYKSI